MASGRSSSPGSRPLSKLSRRSFCVVTVCAVGAAACGCGAPTEVVDPEWPAPVDGVVTLPLAEWPTLREPGGWERGVPLGFDKQVLVAHVGDGDTVADFAALSGRCTHRNCGLVYIEAELQLHCPCHGARFAIDGDLLRGPAEDPLEVFPIDLVDDALLITVA